MPKCPICKKWIKSLGIARHMTMHAEDRASPGYRHNGRIRHKRHKCSNCGRTRKECYMKPTIFKTRFGNTAWICVDNNCPKEFWEDVKYSSLIRI